MKITTHVAALFIVATLASVPSTAQSSEAQKRTPPPKSDPAPAQARPSRKPAPDTPPPKAVPRPPASAQQKAVPRPPASRPPARPAPRSPSRPLDSRTLIYPYFFYDFDFVYRFPYGPYPYPYYPYPYGYPVPVPAPGCATVEGETAVAGGVRLDIPQREAAVYVDGFYVGTVGDFSGAAELLPLVPGPHHLELRSTGYQTLTFDVNIQAGKTITYRTPMQPSS